MQRVLHSTKKSKCHKNISKSKTIPFISNLGEPRDFTCKVKSEGGDGSFYQPPEMQWMIGDGYPSNNENDYEEVYQNLEIQSVYVLICKTYAAPKDLIIHEILQKGTEEWQNRYSYTPKIEDDGKKLMCAVENPEQNLMSDYVNLHVIMFSTDLTSSKNNIRFLIIVKRLSKDSIIRNPYQYFYFFEYQVQEQLNTMKMMDIQNGILSLKPIHQLMRIK